MRRGELWKRGLMTTGLGLSIFLSSFGNVTGVRAAELSEEKSALEIQETDEEVAEEKEAADEDESATETAGNADIEETAETSASSSKNPAFL